MMKLKLPTLLLPLLLITGVYAEQADTKEASTVQTAETEAQVATEQPKQLTEAEQVQQWYEQGARAHRIHDLTAAIKWLGKAAEKDHTEAQALLGYLYLYVDYTEQGLPLLEAAAEKDNLLAIKELVAVYVSGNGVEQNYEKALELLEQGESLGDFSSVYAIADAYEYGKLDLIKDETKARQMYQQLSDKGYVNATRRLIKAVESGQLGFNKDPIKAREMKNKLKSKHIEDSKKN